MTYAFLLMPTCLTGIDQTLYINMWNPNLESNRNMQCI